VSHGLRSICNVRVSGLPSRKPSSYLKKSKRNLAVQGTLSSIYDDYIIFYSDKILILKKKEKKVTSMIYQAARLVLSLYKIVFLL
jgi:hypothetical protein